MQEAVMFEQQLRTAGFREQSPGVFEAQTSPRVVALVQAATSPEDWAEKVDSILRNDAVRIAPSWARYVVLLVDSKKTRVLAAAATAFCRDVSKCRRLVSFRDDSPISVFPFLGLPPAPGGTGTPGQDFDGMATTVLRSPSLAAAFLDEHTPTSRVQSIAEEAEE